MPATRTRGRTTATAPDAADQIKEEQRGKRKRKAASPEELTKPAPEEGVPTSAKPTAPHFLMKSEPTTFSIDQLEAMQQSTEHWDGVRNAQACNLMKTMRTGQRCFFYHSSCPKPGIVGIVEVVREAYPDFTAWDPKSDYFDERSTVEKPKWWMVDIKLVRKLKRLVSLEELKTHASGALKDMPLFNRSRLSIQPITQQQWDYILSLEEIKGEEQ